MWLDISNRKKTDFLTRSIRITVSEREGGKGKNVFAVLPEELGEDGELISGLLDRLAEVLKKRAAK